jgi:hypothetical protein
MQPRPAGYFVLFNGNQESDARAFAANLPEGCDAELSCNEDGGDIWWLAVVTGPWDSPEDGASVVKPLAQRYGGGYEGSGDS